MNKEKQKIIADICPFYKEYGSCDRCNTETEIDDPPCYFECMANAIIDNKYLKVEWFSVYERLPDNGNAVLVNRYNKSLKFSVVNIDNYQGYGKWWDKDYNGEVWTITHWMPLPEPPKGGAE